MPLARSIKPEDRKVTTLKAGWYTINGLHVEIKEEVQVVYSEEWYYPDYETKYKRLEHSYAPQGQFSFSKFRTLSQKSEQD